MRRRFIWLYPAWIALCVILFLALRGADDPSRRGDRILNTEAGTRAITILQQRDPLRFRDYEPVHVAWAGRGEGGEVGRWVVLCDRRVHTGLGDAVVVELEGRSGKLLLIRRAKGEAILYPSRPNAPRQAHPDARAVFRHQAAGS